jgi:hypothetical protein
MAQSSTARVIAFRTRQKHGLAQFTVEVDHVGLVELLKASRLLADENDHAATERALTEFVSLIIEEHKNK